MSNVAIFGSGFGLYGYLPAVMLGCHEVVLLPERYRALLQAREDVRDLGGAVHWVADEQAGRIAADAIIVAQRPQDHVRWMEACLNQPNIKRLLIEKPIASTPEQAARLLDTVSEHRKIFRIGYTFRYPKWGRNLLARHPAADRRSGIDIRWTFRAHHYARHSYNWKRHVSAGGGAVRFYGIQLIALLAEIGYRSVSSSVVSASKIDEAERWCAIFSGPLLPECRIRIDTNSAAEAFSVRISSHEFPEEQTILRDPFTTPGYHQFFDRRVDILTTLCREFLYSDVQIPPWYHNSIDLWDRVERVTRCVFDVSTGA